VGSYRIALGNRRLSHRCALMSSASLIPLLVVTMHWSDRGTVSGAGIAAGLISLAAAAQRSV